MVKDTVEIRTTETTELIHCGGNNRVCECAERQS